jgi:hypothetical protein
MTATESTSEMENHNIEDYMDASHQTKNTTHCVVHQEATFNCIEYSCHHQDKGKKNQTQDQGTHQLEEENPGQLCNPKVETFTTMATHFSKNHKLKRNKQKNTTIMQNLYCDIQ